jgi:hypothetical protein
MAREATFAFRVRPRLEVFEPRGTQFNLSLGFPPRLYPKTCTQPGSAKSGARTVVALHNSVVVL